MVVFEAEQRLTKDGRRRAPRMLWGPRRPPQFPMIRFVLAFGAIAFTMRYYFKQKNEPKTSATFLKRIQIVPWGVLGTQLSLQGSLVPRAELPDADTAIVDPAGLKYIQSTADGAGAASGAIYNWLGLKGRFPDDVRNSIFDECDAKFHNYNGKKVIHVVGPDFRVGTWSERAAAVELSRAYRNVLHEFVLSEATTLRILPISSGVFSGKLYDQMPPLTQEALSMAFEQLHTFDKEYVLDKNKNIELCIFMDREWDMYTKVFDYVTPSHKL